MDRHRFVQQYVERQKAYLPTYTTERLSNERPATPSKPPPSDAFGFDTPVLRPRVPVNTVPQSQPTPQAGSSKSRTHATKKARPPAPPLQPRDRDLGKKQSKRKTASTPIDTDSERAARLADRRERKRKKRAIVDPPQKHDDDIASTTAPKKANEKAKKSAALALLYGFSATNVTKDRLTLKPPHSFGVFAKGKSSAKKKVATTLRPSASRNAVFSESAFLNKPNECRSKIDDDSDNGSLSNRSLPKDGRISNHTKKAHAKCSKTPASRASQASRRKTPESEVWDIELQSKLPSSACDVSSEPGEKHSVPVVLDLRGAEWCASVNVAEEHEQYHNKTRSLSVPGSPSREHSIVRSPPLAGSDLHEESRPPDAAHVPSIHPSHSASQVGPRAADVRASDLRPITSKYFGEPELVAMQEYLSHPTPQRRSRSNDGADAPDSQFLGQDAQDTAANVQTMYRVASPMNSLISLPQPMVEFQMWYDVAPLEFPSDGSQYNDWRADMGVPWEPPGGSDRGYFESCAVEVQGERFIGAPDCQHPDQGTTRDWYRSWSPSVGLDGNDVGYLQGANDDGPADEFEAPEPGCFFEAQVEYEEEPLSEQWYCTAETDYPVFQAQSECVSEESGEDVPGFLEGRALLLGVPEGREWPGLSGLVQAEMDVASRLRRNHWRPLRL